MSTIQIDFETLCEYVLEDWFVEETDQEHWKHDVTQCSVVFKYTDDKFYTLSYMCSYNEGIEDFYAPYTAYEVEPVEVKTTEWVIKKEKTEVAENE